VKVKDPQKVADFFDATLNLTEKTGLAGLKMSAIAQEANVASGTIYVYFSSKEELLNELYKKLKTESVLKLENIDRNTSFKPQLKQIYFAALKYRIENHKEVNFMLQFRNSPFITTENKAIGDNYILQLANFLERGKDEQLIKEISTKILIAAINGILNEFERLCDDTGHVTVKNMELSFQICWDAISA